MIEDEVQQRFSEITNKLFLKGYTLHPVSPTEQVHECSHMAFIKGTHASNNHKEEYLIAVPFQNLTPQLIEVIKNLHLESLYDINSEYVVYFWKSNIDPQSLNQMVSQEAPGKKVLVKKQQQEQAIVEDYSKNIVRISNKLIQLGYEIYSEEDNLRVGKHVSTIVGSYKDRYYLIAIPHIPLPEQGMIIIRNMCSKHRFAHIYKLTKEYLTFHYHELLGIDHIDQIFDQFIQEQRQHSTRRIKASKRPDTRKRSKYDYENILPKTQKTAKRPKVDINNLEGNKIKDYDIITKLGIGGFGIVYLLKKDRNYYVLKIAKSEEYASAIENEIDALKVVNEIINAPKNYRFPKCVPKIYEWDYLGKLPYFIEEFILTLDTIKLLIFTKTQLCDALKLVKLHYHQKAKKQRDTGRRVRFQENISLVDVMLTGKDKPILIDPLLSSHIVCHLCSLIYLINTNNYHYGDLKSDNIGIRLKYMNIIDENRLFAGTPVHLSLKEELIAEQLVVHPDEGLSFTGVMLDFGSLSRYEREGSNEIFFTPKYMIPNELFIKDSKVKKSFIKDPYTLGLVFFNMISGLEPFWDIKLPDDNTDQQVEIIKSLHAAKERPYDLELMEQFIEGNIRDIVCKENATPLSSFIPQHAFRLMGGIYKEQLESVIENMNKHLKNYHHNPQNCRYRVFQKRERTSKYDQLTMEMKKGGGFKKNK